MGEFDVSVDCMGDDLLPEEPSFTALLRATRKGGVVVSYGHPRSGRRFSPYVFQARGLTMIPPEGDLDQIREKGRLILQADVYKRQVPTLQDINLSSKVGCFYAPFL